jgi:hypothetical protein
MTTPAPSRLSRRALFSLAGSAVAVASAAVLLRRRAPDAEAATPRHRGVIPYADHEGWMVTPAEKERLAAAPPVPR